MNNTNQNKGNGSKQGNQGKPYGHNEKGNTKFSVTLPEGYLQNGYFTDADKEKRNKDYIVAYAEQIAKGLEVEGRGVKNNRTQIRKYYDYGLRIGDKLQVKNNDFSYIEADVAQLVSTVVYAKSRGVVTDIFEKFLKKNVNSIEDAKDYRAFMKHFEAVIAYMKK